MWQEKNPILHVGPPTLLSLKRQMIRPLLMGFCPSQISVWCYSNRILMKDDNKCLKVCFNELEIFWHGSRFLKRGLIAYSSGKFKISSPRKRNLYVKIQRKKKRILKSSLEDSCSIRYPVNVVKLIPVRLCSFCFHLVI